VANVLKDVPLTTLAAILIYVRSGFQAGRPARHRPLRLFEFG